MPINNSIINQKGTPAFFSDIFANRPAFGYAGRVFISTDTGAIYEDTGTAWTLIADAGAGTTGTLQQVTTNGNTTTLGISVQGLTIGKGAGAIASNTAIGNLALNSNTTGSGVTAIGSSTLQNNTTGVNNIAIGNSSLFANTTGTNNIGLGGNTLIANTTASYNTALGSLSMSANTTGANNSAIGYVSLANNTTGSTNTAIGSSALQLNTTASNNTAVGEGALQFNTTGAENTSIGASTLRANTTFSFNTALGSGALQNALASQNTAIGYATLQVSTGSGNTAIGYQSQKTNTTGTNNNSLGFNSLRLNTTGGNNVALGTNALQSNTTASDNTAIGNNSLNANTTGTQNTAIGGSTLIVNTTGFGNSAMGYGTMASNTTGQLNIGIGGGSLAANTTGNNNTAIGSFAGSLITTGSNNTILGYYQGTPTLASNIVLADGAGNVRLFSDANGLIGINQAVGSTIGGQLDIHTAQTYALVLNGLTTNNAYTAFSNNNVGKWRIGNTYNAGANSFDIYNFTTSANAMSITSGNLVGIGGTASGTYGKLSVFGGITMKNDNNAKLEIGRYSSSATDSYIVMSLGSTGLTFTNANDIADIMRLTTTGNLLIGSTTDDTINKLQVNGSSKFTGLLTINANTSARALDIVGRTDGTSLLIFWNNAVSVQNAKLTASTSGLLIDGATTISNLAGTGSRAVLADANGLLSAPVSDISVKENINSIGYGLNEILKMNPVWFNYNDEYKNYGEGRQNGNIAQEMKAIIPEAVFTTPTTGKMGINYDQLQAVYIKAIQELKAEIDALKNN